MEPDWSFALFFLFLLVSKYVVCRSIYPWKCTVLLYLTVERLIMSHIAFFSLCIQGNSIHGTERKMKNEK